MVEGGGYSFIQKIYSADQRKRMRDFLTGRTISQTDVEPDVADMQLFQNRAEPIIMVDNTITPTSKKYNLEYRYRRLSGES